MITTPIDNILITKIFDIANHLLTQSKETHPKITDDLSKYIGKTVKITIVPLKITVAFGIENATLRYIESESFETFDLTILMKELSLNNLEIQGNIGLAQALQQLKELNWDIEHDFIQIFGQSQGLWLAQKIKQAGQLINTKTSAFIRQNPYFIHQNDLMQFKIQLRELKIALDRTEQRVRLL